MLYQDPATLNARAACRWRVISYHATGDAAAVARAEGVAADGRFAETVPDTHYGAARKLWYVVSFLRPIAEGESLTPHMHDHPARDDLADIEDAAELYALARSLFAAARAGHPLNVDDVRGALARTADLLGPDDNATRHLTALLDYAARPRLLH